MAKGLEPQHVRVTLVITDVANYTTKVAEAEDDVVRRVASDLDTFSSIAAAHGGWVVANRGDGLKMVFEDPIAAMRAALAMQEAAIAADGRTANPKARIKHRIGLHSGEAVVLGSQVTGRAVAVAARLEQLCPPGKICYSDDVHQSVGKKLDFRRDFGGLEEAHHLPMVKAWIAHAASDLSQEPVALRRTTGRVFEAEVEAADQFVRGFVRGVLTALGIVVFVVVFWWLANHAPRWFMSPDPGGESTIAR